MLASCVEIYEQIESMIQVYNVDSHIYSGGWERCLGRGGAGHGLGAADDLRG